MRTIPLVVAILIGAFVTASVARSQPEPPKDGIYYVHEKGKGPKVTRNDTGATVVLGEKITGHLGKASIVSHSNDNQRLSLYLHGAGPFPVGEFKGTVAAMIAGHCVIITSNSGPEADNSRSLGGNIKGDDAVRTVAKAADIEPKLRKHPGHKFHVTFTPDKKSYAPGAEMHLTITIKNIGANTVTFHDGGRQRGPRDNQFGFTAMRGSGGGKAVLDSGDPTNFGGKGRYVTLKSGELFEKTVRLHNWFHFEDDDTYLITGLYRLEFHDPSDGTYRTLWQDFAVGECYVTVTTPAKK